MEPRRSESDEQLVARLKAGEPDAGRRLYDRFSADVNRVLWRYLRAPVDLDDRVQQVFERVFEGINRLKDPAALRSFVVGTAVNVAKEAHRRRREVSGETDHAKAPDVDFDARDTVRAFYAVTDRMSEDARTVFVLRYVDGRSIRELSELLEWSEATVKRRLTRAEQIFRAMADKEPRLKERLARGTRFGAGHGS
ncbi:MAG: RNA polymerase sigma factor [Myxococcota bacterium]